VQAVRDTFNVRLQVERHPWPMMAGSVMVGYAAGAFLPRPVERFRGRRINHRAIAQERETRQEMTPAHSDRPPWLSRLAESFGPEFAKLRGLAAAALLGTVGDAVAEAMPEKLQSQFRDVFNEITTKLGGPPVRDRVVSNAEQRGEETYPERRRAILGAAQRHNSGAWTAPQE
jgi:hypothetical protein